ncbi:MAG: hypothetical protein ACXWRG_18905 [Bdellovibrio sp.]
MNFFLFIILVLFSVENLHAFEMAAGLTPPKLQKTIISYSGIFHKSSSFDKQSAGTSFQSIDFSTPLYKTDQDAINLKLTGEQFSIRPPHVTYSDLYDLRLSLGYTKTIDENRLWSVSGRYGSASDKPFSESSVSTFGMTAFYSFPSEAGPHRWLLLVDYSNNRPILNNLPLPGFAYFYQPSKEFRAIFGAPFASINWQFSENWGMEFFTLVPWIFKGSVSYKVTDFANLYGGMDFSQATYYIAGRSNYKDRLFYDEKKVFVGLKSPLSQTTVAELELGHSFDRSLFVAENYKTRPDDALDIGNAFYVKVSLRFFY